MSNHECLQLKKHKFRDQRLRRLSKKLLNLLRVTRGKLSLRPPCGKKQAIQTSSRNFYASISIVLSEKKSKFGVILKWANPSPLEGWCCTKKPSENSFDDMELLIVSVRTNHVIIGGLPVLLFRSGSNFGNFSSLRRAFPRRILRSGFCNVKSSTSVVESSFEIPDCERRARPRKNSNSVSCYTAQA